MDVFVYGCGKEEEQYFEQCRKKLNLDIVTCPHKATMENAHLCKGSRCISILSTPMPKELIVQLYEQGVRFISTRTIGYDHVDIKTCQKLNMHVSNVTYSPESVADYTIMLILMALRKMKLIMQSAVIQDYSFAQVQGKNLKDRTLGVIGTGNIGTTLIQHMAGFGCKILAYNPHPKKELEPFVQYTDLKRLYEESDIITLHVPLNEHTYHMINEDAIRQMKDGVVLVNTARGGLIHNHALITAIETGKVGAAALDVVEGETGIYYNNRKGRIYAQHDMAILNSFPNVIMSPHMAFLTEESSRDMVLHSMESCKAYLQGVEDPWRIC